MSSEELLKFHKNQSKFVNKRTDMIEKHLAEICNTFANYASSTAKLRNRGDELAKSLYTFGENETLNRTLHQALVNVADTVACIEDYRNTAVKRLDSEIVSKLSSYERICSSKRETLKGSLEVRRKDLLRQRVIERNTGRRNSMSGVDRRMKDPSRAGKHIEKQLDNFEMKKLEDLKSILQEFAKTELAFHAKAVEQYTKAYQDASRITPEEDMEEFRNALHAGQTDEKELFDADDDEQPTPVIFGSREKAKASNTGNLTKKTDKLQIQDYEEILENSSDENWD